MNIRKHIWFVKSAVLSDTSQAHFGVSKISEVISSKEIILQRLQRKQIFIFNFHNWLFKSFTFDFHGRF